VLLRHEVAEMEATKATKLGRVVSEGSFVGFVAPKWVQVPD
jgi:hypothetical protein